MTDARLAFAPLPPGTLKCESAKSCRPVHYANRASGTRPAEDTRFNSSNGTDPIGRA